MRSTLAWDFDCQLRTAPGGAISARQAHRKKTQGERYFSTNPPFEADRIERWPLQLLLLLNSDVIFVFKLFSFPHACVFFPCAQLACTTQSLNPDSATHGSLGAAILATLQFIVGYQ
jgi:hypothetical protein